MRRWYLFAPLAGLTAFAAYLGLRAGDVPSETDIIERYAAVYVSTAPDGAHRTDCTAVPHPDEAIRMVISCSHESGLTTTYFVGPRGEALPEPEGYSA